jgi:hypothetical protein
VAGAGGAPGEIDEGSAVQRQTGLDVLV